MNLKNKKILITGGSRGIGASIAKEMVIHGGEVAITFKENETAVKKLISNHPKINHFKCDVTNRNEIREIANEIKEKWGRIDVLVNNAGINKP